MFCLKLARNYYLHPKSPAILNVYELPNMVMITFYVRPTVTDQWECSLGERHISAVSFKSNDQTSERSCPNPCYFLELYVSFLFRYWE